MQMPACATPSAQAFFSLDKSENSLSDGVQEHQEYRIFLTAAER